MFLKETERKRVLLVELKTDNNSIKKEQLCNMKKAREKAQAEGMKPLVRGLVKCANHSDEPRKYAQLIWKLHEIGFIEIPIEEEFKRVYGERKAGVGQEFQGSEKGHQKKGNRHQLEL